jgi:hypothetical protein
MNQPTSTISDPQLEIPAPGPRAFEELLEADSSSASALEHWWRIGDFGVLGIWIAVVAFILPYHEKWADEAQAWLIARDLDLRTIWFHELRYEGSPGLWHTILWIAQHVFHAKYGALGYIGMAGATAGVALLIFKAPFPRYIRWPLAFTYFLVYQYAVIARPYTLLPLLAFLAAIFLKDVQHPERVTLVLVLLANLSVHGTILAGCLGLVYLFDALGSWKTLDISVKKRYWISIVAMVATFAFIVLILKPTPDVQEFVEKREIAQLPAEAQVQFGTKSEKLVNIVSGAFLDWVVPSVVFLVLCAAWCFTRGRLFLFTLTVGVMLALYAVIHGAAHHQGTAFVAAITTLWVAWPSELERTQFSVFQRRCQRGMVTLLALLCALNIWDAAVVLQREYKYPYSGAVDAANYLKSVRADRGPIFGFLMGIAGIQAYFDHNIFANTHTSYFHHGVPVEGMSLDVDQLRRIQPDYIVAYSQNPQMMLQVGIPLLTREGYEIVHFSDGYYLYKRTVANREVYFILRHARAATQQPLSGFPQ